MVYHSVKRGREGEIDQSFSTMANYLILLSRGGEFDQIMVDNSSPTTRVFECKTCNRQFPSFQALGGHRASHKKPRTIGADLSQLEELQSSPPKPKIHECTICGLEFAIGQALGGHMRRHRGGAAANEYHPPSPPLSLANPAVKKSNSRRILSLDLNLTPLENDIELQLGKKVAPMVNCFL